MKKQILFIGNSYTCYQRMPEEIFAPMAATAGYRVEISSIMHSDCCLKGFADPENEEGRHLRDAIREKRFDWVVLQDHRWSTIQNSEDFFEELRAVKEILSNHTEHLLFCATWGRKESNEMGSETDLWNESMTMRIANACDEAARRFSFTVAHVGKAFDSYTKINPTVEAYLRNQQHPSLMGGTIAASAILNSMLSARE